MQIQTVICLTGNKYEINASLPASDEDLKNYRIVIINLLYDFKANGSHDELTDLENEFKNSGAVSNLQIPEQHKIYGLDSAFRSDHYAFMWWPIQLSSAAKMFLVKVKLEQQIYTPC
jgi:hypothetical protein